MSEKISPARLVAARALVATESGESADLVLDAFEGSRPDRALARFLTLGVLRQRGTLDGLIRPHLKQPLHTIEAEVRVVLRLGTFERAFARTPPHAIVDQAVELCRALGKKRATGLVNAVLRRVKATGSLSRVERLNHPTWLIERWDQRYGAETVNHWCTQNNEQPVINFVTHHEVAFLDVVGPSEHEITPVSYDETRLKGVFRAQQSPGQISEFPGFSDGLFWIQDVASILVADLVQAGQGNTVLDACAAPGGKTFRLLAQGAQVTAVDRDEDRLNTLRVAAERLSLSPTLVAHDWLKGPIPGKLCYDAVLVDAPCTGLGTVRRHPEIRWRRTVSDLKQAAKRQRRILRNAAKHVKEDGTLVYAVCSPEPEEGERIIHSFLSDHPDFTLETTLCTAPPKEGEDAHFAARMRRR